MIFAVIFDTQILELFPELGVYELTNILAGIVYGTRILLMFLCSISIRKLIQLLGVIRGFSLKLFLISV